jgi:flagellar biosynthesis/type III secretory pathway protein FliH
VAIKTTKKQREKDRLHAEYMKGYRVGFDKGYRDGLDAGRKELQQEFRDLLNVEAPEPDYL